MTKLVANHLRQFGFRPRKPKVVRPKAKRKQPDESMQGRTVETPILADYSHAPTFSARVVDAKIRLAAGEDPGDIRREHGGVVLKAARDILFPERIR